MKRVIVLLSALAALASCATAPKAQRPAAEDLQPLPPLSLSAGYDLYQMRVDIRRAMHEEYKEALTANGEPRVFMVPNDYATLAADFGNGIILDLNRNLSLDLVRYYGLATSKSFAVSMRESAGGKIKTRWTFDNGTYRIERFGLFGPTATTGKIGPKKATCDQDRLEVSMDVNEVRAESLTPLGIHLYSSIKIRSDTQIAFPALMGENTYTREENEIRSSNRYYTLTGKDGAISVSYREESASPRSLTVMRTASSFFVFYDSGAAVELRRDGNDISYLFNGRLRAVYSLESME